VILSLLINFLRLLLLPFSLLRWAFASPRGGYVVLEIDGAVVDLAPPRHPWSRWWRPAHPPLSVERVRQLGKLLAKDGRAVGVLVRIRSLHAGAAVVTSLRDALLEIKATGKDIVVYLPAGADNATLLLASAARLVIAGPGTLIAPLGYASQGYYLRRALEQVGVEPEVLAKGAYKNAGEVLVRDAMSESQKEQVGALLDARHADLCAALAQGRRVDRETVARWIDGAPYGAVQAAEMGLVDAVAHEDELEGLLEDRLPAGGLLRQVPAERYFRARRALALLPLVPRPVIGVIEVHGAIVPRVRVRGDAPTGGFFAGVVDAVDAARGAPGRGPSALTMPVPLASEDRLVASLRAARQNPRIRGVLLHIDSPGGSAVASDHIHHEVLRLAEVKPVVAYLSNVAASGGYYVAVGAHAIIAQPLTVTGSIGVVSARIGIGPLLERLGISVDVLKRGARADLFSPARRLGEDERAVLERELDIYYRTFLDVVARGRRRPVEEIEPLAGGRVWSGADAQARGLVDSLGGFERALHVLRQMVGPQGARIEPVIVRVARYIPPPPPLPAPVPAVLEALGLAPAADLLSLAAHTPGERVLAWDPESASLR